MMIAVARKGAALILTNPTATTRHKYITKYNKLIMAETILITGATGTLGGEVVKQLSSKTEQDVTVKAVARSANDSIFGSFRRVQLVQVNYNKPDTLSAAFKGVDKLFLL